MTAGREAGAIRSDLDPIERGGYKLALRPRGAHWRVAVIDETTLWLREKGIDLDLTREVRTVIDGRKVRAMHHRQGEVEAFLLSMGETNDGGTFETTVLAVDDPENPWLMVRVVNDRRRNFPAPRLAERLLNRLDLLDGSHRLSSVPQIVHPGMLDDLVARLHDPSRRGVVLAVGTGDIISPALITPRLEKWGKNAIGLAQIAILTPDSTRAFAEMAGAHSVPEGTIRTFGKGVDFTDATSARGHRMLSPRTVADSPEWQIRELLTVFARAPLSALPMPSPLARWDRIFDRLLNREMTSRIVVPRIVPTGRVTVQSDAELERVRSTLGLPDLSEPNLLSLVEAATSPAVDQAAVELVERKILELQEEKEALEDELARAIGAEWSAREEAVEADEQLNELRADLLKLQRSIRSKGIDPWVLGVETDSDGVDVPQLSGSWADLAKNVADWEPFGAFITAENRYLVEMDSVDLDGRALRAAHQCLEALAGYVSARQCGDHTQDFGRYLEDQPPGYSSYPFKKFVPTETKWTKANFGDERKFPAPAWLGVGTEVTMNAHLRLTRIPNKDPRLYFMDARDGSDKFAVIVGYIGKHLSNRATAGLN